MTQKQKIRDQLRIYGKVTRNWALSNYITRLSAIILDLKKDGLKIKSEFKDKDYIYTIETPEKPKSSPTGTINLKDLKLRNQYNREMRKLEYKDGKLIIKF